jgi:hypothetical protein
VFGSGALLARIYNKSLQARQRHDDAYAALVAERTPDTFDPARDVWRLEFQLRREGTTGFRLYTEPDSEDDEATIEVELAAEELPHLGTLPRFFHYQDALWRHLTTHWLRLVEDDGTANRSRWPTHPTWAHLRDNFASLVDVTPLDEATYQVVREARYSGKSRILRRMLLGVVNSLEVEDAAPASAALDALRRWADRTAEREAERAEVRRVRYEATLGSVPEWVDRGLGERVARAETIRHRVQMLLGICAARGVLPLHREPVTCVQDLVWQHLDDLQDEAERKGSPEHLLANHFAKVYRVAAPRGLFSPSAARIA